MTIKEIANHLNLSPTTVSNVMRGRTGEVSPATIEKVNRYLEEVDYAPNYSAQNLAGRRSRIIGFVMMKPDYRNVNIFTDPFVAELVGSIQTRVHTAGYFMMQYISDSAEEVIQYLSGWNVDGLILFAPNDEDALKITSAYHKPVVFIDTCTGEKTALSPDGWFVNVGLDDEAAAYNAVSFLIKKGHKKIAFLSRSFMGIDILRHKGYERALREAGLEVPGDGLLIRYSDTEEKEYLKLARTASGFSAVFACSDTSAILLSNALWELGLRVPEDISLIGFDDNAVCELARPALTTVRQDISLKGRTAVEALIEMLEGVYPKAHEINLPTELIERSSVKCIADGNV